MPGEEIGGSGGLRRARRPLAILGSPGLLALPLAFEKPCNQPSIAPKLLLKASMILMIFWGAAVRPQNLDAMPWIITVAHKSYQGKHGTLKGLIRPLTGLIGPLRALWSS